MDNEEEEKDFDPTKNNNLDDDFLGDDLGGDYDELDEEEDDSLLDPYDSSSTSYE